MLLQQTLLACCLTNSLSAVVELTVDLEFIWKPYSKLSVDIFLSVWKIIIQTVTIINPVHNQATYQNICCLVHRIFPIFMKIILYSTASFFLIVYIMSYENWHYSVTDNIQYKVFLLSTGIFNISITILIYSLKYFDFRSLWQVV